MEKARESDGGMRRPRRALWLAVPLLAALGMLLALRLPLAAATITVADGEVDVAENNVCSLVEALENANDTGTGQLHDDCAAGDPAGPDTVSLAANGVYTLTQIVATEEISAGLPSDLGLPPISTTVILDGNGAEIVRDCCSDEFGLLGVFPSGNLTVNDVLLSGGSAEAGGAIVSSGAVTVTNSGFEDHVGYEGGAIACLGGSLEVSSSSFFFNQAVAGGGVFAADCDAAVRDSLLVYNFGIFGGATAVVSGTLTVERNTMVINRAESGCGAHVLSGEGGAASVVNTTASDPIGFSLCAVTGTMTIDNSTVVEGDIFGGSAYYGGVVASTSFDDFDGISPTGIAEAVPASDLARLARSLRADSRWSGKVPADFALRLPGAMPERNGRSAHVLAAAGLFVPRSQVEPTPPVVVTPLITVTRSIVSGPDDDDSEIVAEEEGMIVSGGYNVLGNADYTAAESFVNFTPAATDVNATSDFGNIPFEDIIQDEFVTYGSPDGGSGAGGFYRLPAGSPAIDLGLSADCVTGSVVDGVDQINNPRNVDDPSVNNGPTRLCDSGAIEMQLAPDVYAAAASGTADNDTAPDVSFTQADVLSWDGEEWAKYFDGTDEGINATADIIALDVDDPGQGSLYLGWRQTQVVPGVGRVVPQEIVYFDGNSFSRFFDGRDVGLTLTSERPNGLVVLDGSVWSGSETCQAYLLISTMAGGKVRNGTDPIISFTGEDLLGFCMLTGGSNTTGLWELVFEGQSNGLKKNSTLGLAADDAADTFYFTTKGTFPAGVNNVLPYDGSLGGSVFDFTANGLSSLVDSIDFAEPADPDICTAGDTLAGVDC